MKQTTLCYLERDGQYLMLHRVKKQNDASHDKWIGVGGKCEADESPDECMLREVKEETGLQIPSSAMFGLVNTCTSSPPPIGAVKSASVTRVIWRGLISPVCLISTYGRATRYSSGY